MLTRVHKEIRDAILDGRLRPGDRLVETRLAEELGVSRTPVREALMRLNVEGLVDSSARGGAVVGNTVLELEEIYGLRCRVEGYAARLAATRITSEELAMMQKTLAEAEAALSASIEVRADINRRFHTQLGEAAHSPRIARLVTEWYAYSVNERTLKHLNPNVTSAQLDQHRSIVSALMERDGSRAEAELCAHLESALAVLQKAFKAEE